MSPKWVFWLREDYKVENSLKRHFISVLKLKNDYILRFKTSKGKLIIIIPLWSRDEAHQFNIFNVFFSNPPAILIQVDHLLNITVSHILFVQYAILLVSCHSVHYPLCLLHVWQIHFLFSSNSCWRIFVAFTLSSPSCWDIKSSSWRLKPFALKKNISQDCQFLTLH